MAVDTFIIITVIVVVVCLLIYAAYRRHKGIIPKPNREEPLNFLEKDALFNNTLTSDQIRALHRLVSSSV
ncbi:SWPV1-224 [Shearwaterpox virus]|uniref:SWPV1-224 n=1 Tax=Shearwaterpox virus TaxID=1974596 RepID=A0A1V0S840_CNPV|nr:SWPV1-224 [Shearwaterpox virus]